MFKMNPLKNNQQHSKQLQNNTTQFAKTIGNQAILQFGQRHHVIPKELHEKYGIYFSRFNVDTKVEIEDHSGSHPKYSNAVKQALEHCRSHGIDCDDFADTLKTHISGLNSVKNIDFTYLLKNVIETLPSAPASYQSSSGTRHTSRTMFDPSPPPPPPTSSRGRLLKPKHFDD